MNEIRSMNWRDPENSVRKTTKKLISVFIMMSVVLMCTSSAFASVTVSETKSASGDRIAIAGNPAFFPYEYYDADTNTYKGVFPRLYEMISEKTGLEFEYVGASESDTRLVQAKTGYAQIVSAYMMNGSQQEKYLLKNEIHLLEYEQEGETVSIGIVFSPNADEEIVDAVTAGFAAIPDETVATLMGETVNAESKGVDNTGIIALVILILIIAAGALLMLNSYRRKKSGEKKVDRRNRYTDSLTGLGNRYYLASEFERQIAFRHDSGYCLTYVGFDTDKTGRIYGEERVEELVGRSARVLEQACRSNETVARVSGGGFAVISNSTSEQVSAEWAENIVDKLNRTQLESGEFTAYFKAGVLALSAGTWDFDKAMRSVLKCYTAAVKEEKNVYVYSEEMRKQDRINDILRQDMSSAMLNRDIVQYLQPIVDLKSGKIVGFEGLSRWDHPRLGMLTPVSYIDMMLEDGKILDLDMYLFEACCRRLSEWTKLGRNYYISTNFTRYSISDPGFVGRMSDILSRYDFPRANLVIEVTEDSLFRNEEDAVHNIKACRNAGFKVALDDLGAGFTFFSDLSNFVFDVIKIDRILITGATGEKEYTLMNGIVNTCKSLGMKIICEGVETAEQLRLAEKMGCDMIQGYYYYKVLSPEEVEELI